MLKLVVATVAAAFVCISQATADFGDCTDRDYLGNFGFIDARAEPFNPILEVLCVTEFELDYLSAQGPRRIRGIRDVNADWAFDSGAAEKVEAGARAAIEAMKLLGDYNIVDITILLLDDTYIRESDRNPNQRGVTGALTAPYILREECLITVYMRAPAGDARSVAYDIAHEIFHCIQNSSLFPQQLDTMAHEGAWWSEGSAEYFAALALPRAGDIFERIFDFEKEVEAATPLYDQTYGMAVFFYWFHQRRGANELMPFLRSMAGVNTDAAQRSAMRDFLSAQDWLDFAQRYADRSITAPAGQKLNYNMELEGDKILFAETRSEEIPLAPFVLRRGWITYECGVWANELQPDDANLGAREETEELWGSYPEEVDTNPEPSIRYRFAALHTEDAGISARLRVERTESCEPCAGSKELDACVVGTWRMTAGGPIEWMRAQGINIPQADTGVRTIRFDERGFYQTDQFDASVIVQGDDVRGEGSGTARAATGSWSIAEGQLAVCQTSGGASGTVSMPQGDVPFTVPGGGTILSNYACSSTTLVTRQDMGRGSMMSTTYTRISPPPTDLK